MLVRESEVREKETGAHQRLRNDRRVSNILPRSTHPLLNRLVVRTVLSELVPTPSCWSEKEHLYVEQVSN